jgi:hypothetical protein
MQVMSRIYEAWYPPNMFIRASGLRHVGYVNNLSANKGENIAQRVCVERILYNNTAEKTRRRRYMALPEAVTWRFLPSTFYPRLLTLDFLPSTFYPRLFTLTLDFLPSPSTFYPRPRLFTLALDI